jgi:enoyl-[acyl-carrier protein] reductase II
VVNEWITREQEVVYPPEPSELIGQTILSGKPVPLPKFSSLPPTPDATGDFGEMALIAGEGVGLVKEIKPAGEIVHGMMEEARQIIEYRLRGALSTLNV